VSAVEDGGREVMDAERSIQRGGPFARHAPGSADSVATPPESMVSEMGCSSRRANVRPHRVAMARISAGCRVTALRLSGPVSARHGGPARSKVTPSRRAVAGRIDLTTSKLTRRGTPIDRRRTPIRPSKGTTAPGRALLELPRSGLVISRPPAPRAAERTGRDGPAEMPCEARMVGSDLARGTAMSGSSQAIRRTLARQPLRGERLRRAAGSLPVGSRGCESTITMPGRQHGIEASRLGEQLLASARARPEAGRARPRPAWRQQPEGTVARLRCC
jgi:hypothetical protein